MPESPNEILLVTPVWNDADRLGVFGETLAPALAACDLPIRWLIADDCSGGNQPERLAGLREKFSAIFPNVHLHIADAHRGKGSVVREAWTLRPDADFLAFVDADGAIPAPDLLCLIEQAVEQDSSVLGIRKRTDHTRVVASPYRNFIHYAFLFCAHHLLDLQCADPQCGVKILKGSDYRRIAHRLEEIGLAFDSELLATLKRSGSEWLETPVNWTEKKGGKVKPVRHGWGMLLALFRIRRRLEEPF
ncbi:MAG: hypothetical protein Q7R22_001345 [Verrucomicrobiota bacterium JB025]|nr:hypothetical protein [Verrucomicrobiota bacterium JB025]